MPKEKLSTHIEFPGDLRRTRSTNEPVLRRYPGLTGHITFAEKVKASNGSEAGLGPENGRTVSGRSVRKFGRKKFTGRTNFSEGRNAGRYPISFIRHPDGKYTITTKYGDPANPAEYHELWDSPAEEEYMKKQYRDALDREEEPRYTVSEDMAQRVAQKLHEEELEEYVKLASEGVLQKIKLGGRRTHKQKRHRKQKTKKQRTNRK